jgi:hypothetical protein
VETAENDSLNAPVMSGGSWLFARLCRINERDNPCDRLAFFGDDDRLTGLPANQPFTID